MEGHADQTIPGHDFDLRDYRWHCQFLFRSFCGALAHFDGYKPSCISYLPALVTKVIITQAFAFCGLTRRGTGRHLSFVSATSVGGAVQVSPVSATVGPQVDRLAYTER